FTIVPLIRHLCQSRQILDHPGALKIHAKAVPRLGGVAIFLGVLAGISTSDLRNFTAHWQFFVAIFVIWVAGLVDDLRGLRPAWRLGAQILSAVLLWQGGWHIPFVTAPIQILMLCVLVILFANSFNFLDGSDGLATGVSLVIALSYIVMPRTSLTSLAFSLALCMAAACVAFLPFNRYPASMFLGDSGATLLGFLAAFIGLDFANTTTAPKYSIVLALTIGALPIFDSLRVVSRRIARGAFPLSGDRNHFYDALLAKRWAPHSVAMGSWTVVAFCGAIAVSIVRLRASLAWSSVAFGTVAVWIGLAAAPRRKKLAGDCGTVETRFVTARKSSEANPQEGKEL
ncbi:MAG TPA: MraY family glycosyltransferase, partial [Candidatus Acidoferrales bacterium]|nr:MraY family glycosyltransferase [Candidatus Acidoferrales bacterium]